MEPQENRLIKNFTPNPHALHIFYTDDPKNGPWYPPGAIQPPAHGDQAAATKPSTRRRASRSRLSDYRGSDLTSNSESTTIPEDSGYGSIGQTYSTVSGSEYLLDQVAINLKYNQESLNYASDLIIEPQSQARTPPNPSLRCDTCHAVMKSQGELKKHKQRHAKSFKCTIPGCTKGQQGFSTANDLVRHRRSVHGQHDLPGRSFVCINCTPSPKGPKIWPRADNFRQHLWRAHQKKVNADDDLSEYIWRSSSRRSDLNGAIESPGPNETPIPPPSPDKSASSPVDPNLAIYDYSNILDSQYTVRQSSMPMSMSMELDSPFLEASSTQALNVTDTASPITVNHAFVQPADLDHRMMGVQSVVASNDFAFRAQGETEIMNDPFTTLSNDDYAATPAARSGLDPGAISSIGYSPAFGMEWQNSDMDQFVGDSGEQDEVGVYGDIISEFSELQNMETNERSTMFMPTRPNLIASDRPGLLRLLKGLPKEMLEKALREDDSPETEHGSQWSDTGFKTQVECPDSGCDKTFNRQCELKKHMKRHQKPYGCTFKSCRKRFGSKNDWKRHESSQHYMLEKWDCDESGCGKVCQRRESFKNHLQKDHGMVDAEEIEEKLESCRLGRHCDPRFWCGFCVRVIDIAVNDRGGNSWTKRCDHIDSHLFGKDGLARKCIREWRHQEDEQRGPAAPDDADSARNSVGPRAAQHAHEEEQVCNCKRVGSVDACSRPRKRSVKAQFYMWKCCQCGAIVNLKTSSLCFECDHARCATDCTAEPVVSQDSENETFGGA